MGVRGTLAVVQVGSPFVRMRVPHDTAIGHHVHVLVFVVVRHAAVVHMAVMVEVIVSFLVTMRAVMGVVVAVLGAVGVAMLVAVVIDVVAIVPVAVHGSVGVHVFMLAGLRTFDPGFAVTAATGRAHRLLRRPPQATSISLTFISSPCVTCSW
jgi:hypothetical protein